MILIEANNTHKGNIMNHSELAQLAASLETSIEVMEVIADKANGDKAAMLKIHADGDKDLEVLAFADTEEDELNWGEQTIYRYSEDVRNFVEKHIHTGDDGHDFMSSDVRDSCECLADSKEHLMAIIQEWVFDSVLLKLNYQLLAERDLEILDNNDELISECSAKLIAECAAKYIISE